jgi:hypothetical protein
MSRPDQIAHGPKKSDPLEPLIKRYGMPYLTGHRARLAIHRRLRQFIRAHPEVRIDHLAELLGVGEQAVWKWITCQCRPGRRSEEMLFRIMRSYKKQSKKRRELWLTRYGRRKPKARTDRILDTAQHYILKRIDRDAEFE